MPVPEELAVVVRVQVDETRRHDAIAGVDDAPRASCRDRLPRHEGDAIPAEGDVGGKALLAEFADNIVEVEVDIANGLPVMTVVVPVPRLGTSMMDEKQR